LNGAAKAVQ
jgi:hypothetical protein